MLVLHFITKTELGGAQSNLLDLLGARDEGLRHIVCGGSEGWLLDEARKKGIECYVLPELLRRINPLQDFRCLLGFRALVKSLQPNLVHAHTAKAGVVARIVCGTLRIPCVYSPHGWAFSPRSGRLLRALAAIVEFALAPLTSVAICASAEEKRIAKKFLVGRICRCEVILHGCPDRIANESRINGDALQAVMIARFAPPKEQEFVLSAFAGIAGDYRLLFVGEGPKMADAMKRCGELGMTDRVTFCGSRTDIPEILSESAMLVHASGYEAFGLSVLEAMRAALPVVATNTGALPEVIADGITGILSEHGDTQQFRSAVETLLLDSELRARMGRAGRERYLQEFTVEAMQEKTLRVYKSLIVAGS